jgi:hypothetical protein
MKYSAAYPHFRICAVKRQIFAPKALFVIFGLNLAEN